MLANVSIPVAELANLKPVQCTVLAGLLAFADRAGRCWPGLRKLAEITGLTLSRVHRAIVDMEEAGILTRVRRGAGTLYQLAERFVRQAIRPKGAPIGAGLSEPATIRPKGVDPSDTLSEPAEGSSHGTANCSTSEKVSSASGTEGESRKEKKEDFKREEGSVAAAPPCRPTMSPCHSSPPVRPPVKAPTRPAEGPNPFARRQWLRTLNTFVGERLKGSQQWTGWEVVAKAINGDSLAPDERRQLDGLDRMMRRCGYRAGG